MKKFVIVAITALLVFGLIGCSGTTPAASETASEPASASASASAASSNAAVATPPVASPSKALTFGVLYCQLSAPAVKAIVAPLEAKAKELSITLVELDAQWDAQKQTDQMNSVITQKVDAILLNPVDSKSVVPGVQKASEAKIPVVCFGMDIDASGNDYKSCYVGEDEEAVGKAAGAEMIKALNGKDAKVLIVEGTPGTDPQINRTKGFEEAVANTPSIQIVAKVNGKFDTAAAMTVTQDALTKNSDINAIWVHDDTMCVGVVQAMKTMNYTGKDITVISYNCNKNGYNFVKSGDIYATMVQSLPWTAETAVQAAVDAVAGVPIEKAYHEPSIQAIDSSNADSYDQSLLW